MKYKTKEILGYGLGLTPLSKNQFYNLLGCVIVGWKLISMPNKSEYKPYFVVYPLWEDSLAKCMNSPLLLMSLKTNGVDT